MPPEKDLNEFSVFPATASSSAARIPLSISQLHKELLSSVCDLIFILDRSGRYRSFSERGGMMPLGTRIIDVCGKTPTEAFGERLGKNFEKNNIKVFESGEPLFLTENVEVDGIKRELSTILSPIMDSEGRVEAVLGICRDVSAIKKFADGVTNYAEHAASALERRVVYEQLISELSQAAIKRQPIEVFAKSEIDRLGSVLDVGRASLFKYNWDGGKLIVFYEWRAAGVLSVREEMGEIPIGIAPWFTEEMLANRSIHYHDIEDIEDKKFRDLLKDKFGVKTLLVVPLFVLGKLYGFFSFDDCRAKRDWEEIDIELIKIVCRITAQAIERDELEKEIIKTERFAAIGCLAAGLAHEINNPLQGMLLHMETIGLEINERRQKNFGYVMEGIRRISDIVARLLNMSRGMDELKEIDINALISDVVEFFEMQLSIRRCRVEFALDENKPKILGDEKMLKQIFMNVLINSMDSMERDGGCIEITTRRDGPDVLISIADEGTGVEEGYVARAFEPFVSTKGPRGTGLGLFVTRSIVEKHGGKIEMKKRAVKGTEIMISFPLPTKKS